jgi:hypothetical protein
VGKAELFGFALNMEALRQDAPTLASSAEEIG